MLELLPAKSETQVLSGDTYHLDDWWDDFSSQEMYTIPRQSKSSDHLILLSTKDVHYAYLKWAAKKKYFPADTRYFGKYVRRKTGRKFRLMNKGHRVCYYAFKTDLLSQFGL